jgi:hypothetical protein
LDSRELGNFFSSPDIVMVKEIKINRIYSMRGKNEKCRLNFTQEVETG